MLFLRPHWTCFLLCSAPYVRYSLLVDNDFWTAYKPTLGFAGLTFRASLYIPILPYPKIGCKHKRRLCSRRYVPVWPARGGFKTRPPRRPHYALISEFRMRLQKVIGQFERGLSAPMPLCAAMPFSSRASLPALLGTHSLSCHIHLPWAGPGGNPRLAPVGWVGKARFAAERLAHLTRIFDGLEPKNQ
jgi:hypothetical protein